MNSRQKSRELPSESYLRDLMHRYQVKDLVNVGPEDFKREVDKYLRWSDHEMEGLKDTSRQRDLTVGFHWGHDHDFGPIT